MQVTVLCPTHSLGLALGRCLLGRGHAVRGFHHPGRAQILVVTDAPVALVSSTCRALSGGVA